MYRPSKRGRPKFGSLSSQRLPPAHFMKGFNSTHPLDPTTRHPISGTTTASTTSCFRHKVQKDDYLATSALPGLDHGQLDSRCQSSWLIQQPPLSWPGHLFPNHSRNIDRSWRLPSRIPRAADSFLGHNSPCWNGAMFQTEGEICRDLDHRQFKYFARCLLQIDFAQEISCRHIFLFPTAPYLAHRIEHMMNIQASVN